MEFCYWYRPNSPEMTALTLNYHLRRAQNWKEKAMSRQEENKYLKQRVRELAQSRENWKARAMEKGHSPPTGPELVLEEKKKRR